MRLHYLVFFLAAGLLHADTAYFQRIIFDNSLTGDRYFHSSGKASAPSTLLLEDRKLPVDTKTFFTGPNALRLQWKSMPDGGWVAEIRVDAWRNRPLYFPGDTLFLRDCSPRGSTFTAKNLTARSLTCGKPLIGAGFKEHRKVSFFTGTGRRNIRGTSITGSPDGTRP
jgi:hypothetical protein